MTLDDGTVVTFTTLVSAVGDAGLTDALAGDGPLTIFAPTDAAFEALGADNIPTDMEELSNILQGHIVGGALDAATIVANAGSSVETLNSSLIAIVDDGAGITVGGAGLVTTDIPTSNGIIHAIDAVILPAVEEPVDPEDPVDPPPVSYTHLTLPTKA